MEAFINILATWRATSLLVNEDGPANIFQILRDWADTNSPFLADVLACVWCCSVWVGFGLPYLPRPFRVALALSVTAIFIQYGMDLAIMSPEDAHEELP